MDDGLQSSSLAVQISTLRLFIWLCQDLNEIHDEVRKTIEGKEKEFMESSGMVSPGYNLTYKQTFTITRDTYQATGIPSSGFGPSVALPSCAGPQIQRLAQERRYTIHRASPLQACNSIKDFSMRIQEVGARIFNIPPPLEM